MKLSRLFIPLLLLAIGALFAPAYASAQTATMTVGGQTISHNQVTVSTTATLVLPSRPNRQHTNITIGEANQCYFGNSAVTTGNGWAPAPVAGTSFVYNNASALYAVCASSTTISFLESY